MSTLGVFSMLMSYHEYTGGHEDACGGSHEHTGRCSVHQRDTMSTLGDFGTNKKTPGPNFQDFCSSTFCDYAVVCICWPLEHQTAC